ncbi:MAG: hypothetical protein J7J36_05025 [Thermoplasmata archaeon]|nr:hypothetical protein [Thermoplasmata archaeon]
MEDDSVLSEEEKKILEESIKEFEEGKAVKLENFEREERLFKLADEILKNSELDDEQIEELSNRVKERVAKRHGIQ